MNQRSTEPVSDRQSVQTGRFRQILPLLVAMLPAVSGLGFQTAGPRPQTLRNRNQQPPLAFHQHMVNLGPVAAQRSHAAVFSFTNRGDKAMKLRRLETSCGCLTQQLEQKIVLPGEDGRFRLWIQTASQTAGEKQYTCKAIYGPADDPSVEYQAELIFRVTLPEQSVVVTPKAMIFHQPNSQVTERTVDITDLRSKRLRVTGVKSQSPLLALQLLPASDLTARERDEGVAGRISVAVGEVPPGTHNAVVEISTDDEEFDQLVVPVLIYGPDSTTDAGADHTNETARPNSDVPNFSD